MPTKMSAAPLTENDSSSAIPLPQTKYEDEVLLSSKQLSEYWDLFPSCTQRALNKAKKGVLPKVSSEELQSQIDNYLEKNTAK